MAERKDINSPAAFGKRFEKRDRVPGMTDHGPLAVGEVELWPGMKVISMEEQRQIFSWNDGLGTGPGHDWVFDVTSLRNAIHNGTVRSTIINMPVDQEVYDYLMKKRGVEEDRVKALEPIDLADPAICLLMFRPDIEEWVPLTIDGSHRTIRTTWPWKELKRSSSKGSLMYLLHKDGRLWRMSERKLIELKKKIVARESYDLDNYGVMVALRVYTTERLMFENVKRKV
jgi:hypothetical protein